MDSEGLTEGQRQAIDLLTPDPDRIPSVVDQVWGPFIGGAFGFGLMCASSYMMRRPVFSGIQLHILATVVGAGLGKWLEGNRVQFYAERDAIYRHYIQLHPDDFPAKDRKKWAEVITPWAPIR